MTSVRLLPLVLVAVSSLLVLKTAGLWFNSSFLTGGVTLAQAQSVSDPEEPTDAPQNAEPADGENSGDSATQQEQAVEADPPLAPHPDEVGRVVQAGQAADGSRSAVLERLKERRQQLEALERDVTMRENLLQAAEKQLDGRIAELKAIESRIEAAVGERENEQKAQLDGLVTMYETMKPKDAARIFNQLDLPILIDVVTQIKARKMAAILAAMDSDAAERLTVEIATRGQQSPFQNEEMAEDSDLPKIGEDSPS